MGEEIKEQDRSADEAGKHVVVDVDDPPWVKEQDRSADEAGKHVVVDVDDPPWVKYMEAKLAFKSKHCKPSHPFTICRVPRDIRSVDNVAHDPFIISIGPYHRGNPSLQETEEVKWRNLNEIRHRDGNKFKDCLKAMNEIEPRARACYSGNIEMEADEFIEMMLLDGLFINELLRTQGHSFLALLGFVNINDEEPFYTRMLSLVGHDMLLLENQLPFFVLKCLWNLTDQRSRSVLWNSACTFILDFSLPFQHEWDLDLLQVIFDEEEKRKENTEMTNEDGVHHLLHLVYLLLQPTSLANTKKFKPMEPTTTGSSSESMEPTEKLPTFIEKMKTLSFLPPRCCDCLPSRSGQESQSMEYTAKLAAFIKKILPCLSPGDEQLPPLELIPSAVELDEAGVEFRCVQAKSFLDIEFERGTMKMPQLRVQDDTISLLRNLIAFEQSFPNRGSHITSYCSFMDDLVNTPRDVEILKKIGIIENFLGCDKEVADLFNDLCKGIVLPDESRNYLAKPSKDVRDHTERVWPKWRAKLLHDYFGSPWSIISFLAATIVIILTIVQTCYALFT